MDERDLSFFEHLMEFRRSLIVILILNFGAMVILFPLATRLLPIFLDINPGLNLVYITPSEMLMLYVQMAVLGGVALCFPMTLFILWRFVAGGLTKGERRRGVGALLAGLVMFVIGAYFCYRFVVPLVLSYLYKLGVESVPSMVSIKSYVAFIMGTCFAFGVVFEMPVVVFLLAATGLIRARTLQRGQRYYIIIILVAAAFLTPPDILSQLLLAIPMILLFELSILIAWVTEKLRGRKLKRRTD